jgi:hypothetical protein
VKKTTKGEVKASRSASKAASKPAAKNKSAAKPAAKKKAATRPPARAAMVAPRADFGQPIDAFFARQPAPLRAILDELRGLVEEEAPETDSSLKWGMPFYSLGGAMMCALAGHKAHVNLILAGPPSAYADPRGLLEGEGKTGRHLKLRPGVAIPRDDVRGWIATAAELARAKKT